jgi:hypothetical protein
MANYRAISNGNWSNLAIWEDDSIGYFAPSSVLPTSADDVYANNFTVTIDGTRNAFTIRNTAFIPPTQLALMSIPQMSSNTTPSGAAAASSAGGSFPAAWYAFDRNTGRYWQSNTQNTGWLSYNFPTGKIIKRYGFFTYIANQFNIRTWTFEGSNDGSTWTILDTQTNFVTGVSTFYSFDISANTTSYTYYRINVTAVQTLNNTPIISELEMSEVTNLYGGTTAGGGFTFANGGDLTCSASNGIEVGSTTPTLLFDLPSGQIATFNGSASNSFSVTNSQNIRSSGSGIFNIVGNLNIFTVGGAVGNRRTLLINGNGTINILGNIDCASNQSNTVSTIDVTSNCTINHTGIITGGAYSVLSVATSVSLRITTQCTYNLTGNVIGSTNAAIGSVATANINIIGNATGSVSGPAILNTTAPLIIDVLGITTSGSGSSAINGLATTFVKLRGNIVNTDTYCAIYAGRVTIDDNVTSWQFKDSTNTITRTLYTAGVNLGNPLESNVRNGIIYGASGELTGTAFIPLPANVLQGVPVDATVGTLLMTPADMWNYLTSSITTPGSIGEAVLDIKSRTDLIPNNPASVDAVGAIVASYNV